MKDPLKVSDKIVVGLAYHLSDRRKSKGPETLDLIVMLKYSQDL